MNISTLMAKNTKVTDITGQGHTTLDVLNTVLNEKKPIFLKIYANWCGACKGLAQEWNNLCEDEDMKNEDLNFLAIEEQAVNALKINNKLPEELRTLFENVAGYPTLVFLNIDGADVGQYNDTRTASKMKDGIKANLAAMKTNTKTKKGGGMMTGGRRRQTRRRRSGKKELVKKTRRNKINRKTRRNKINRKNTKRMH